MESVQSQRRQVLLSVANLNIVTLLQALSDTATVASFGSPRPHSENIQVVPAPSPLTPLPRWGEGNRSLSSFSRDEECRPYVL